MLKMAEYRPEFIIIVVIITYDKYTLVRDGLTGNYGFLFSLTSQVCDVFHKYNIKIPTVFYSDEISMKNPTYREHLVFNFLKTIITDVVSRVFDCNCSYIVPHCLFIAMLFKLRLLRPTVSSLQKTVFNYAIFVRIHIQ